MKVKNPKAPADTGYLGHFRNCLREGHNTNPWEGIDASLPKTKEPKKPVTKSPLPGGVRG